MTTPPDGPRNDHGDDGSDNNDPFSEMLRRMFGEQAPNPEEIRRAMQQMSDQSAMPLDPAMFNPAMMQQMMSQFQAMMSSGNSDEPVNWALVRQTARQAAAGDDPSVGTFARREIEDALRLAELWLDQATTMESTGYSGVAWSRAEWVEKTLDQWKEMTEPVATSVSQALSRALSEQLPGQLPEEMRAAMGDIGPMMKNMGGTIFGLQLGQALGELSREVLSGTDSGFPVAGHRLVMLPVNVEEFGDGLQVPEDQIRIYLALREAARMRLFVHSPWLERDLMAAVQQYAAGLTIDLSSIEDAAQSVDPMNPESMQEVFSGRMLVPEPTGPQKAALEQLETTLAVIEGWVDVVTTQAAQALESEAALREMINRRRATGGPAEHAFGSLVGLDLRPRRLREAAAFWQKITDEKGTEYRDSIWEEQLWIPTAEDLDDPDGYEARRQAQAEQTEQMDEELRKLLDGGFNDDGQTPGKDR
ncbi:zinc-dependent metalloprotease [Auritidibacter ignavus]|uniref:zinc-dependent metalloprotease n=1 Tax=Auritidibacter ignavus TaxID=678932 RepID=UPI0024493860|nr:zinc-dependent metalloprotease [Auritidibacter ignavus]WGH83956.1 zinc-dependent metalloprotease [Auritidibacter ignavus]WHS28368.1 zinc-dependent metalloprotease [Auritidibacter ignavus]